MRTVKAIIERGKDGSFDINMEYLQDYPFGVMGQGATVEEAKADFLNTYVEMKELMEEQNVDYEELEFIFLYDTSAFLQSLSATFSMAGLARITGMNRKQLGHYVQGVNKPRANTAARIQQSVLAYVNEITNARFI